MTFTRARFFEHSNQPGGATEGDDEVGEDNNEEKGDEDDNGDDNDQNPAADCRSPPSVCIVKFTKGPVNDKRETRPARRRRLGK